MVVLGRLAWIKAQIEAGASVAVSLLPSQDGHALKVKVIIKPECQRMPLFAAQAVLASLEAIGSAAAFNVSVDRGHKNSAGESMMLLWIRAPQACKADQNTRSDLGRGVPAAQAPSFTGAEPSDVPACGVSASVTNDDHGLVPAPMAADGGPHRVLRRHAAEPLDPDPLDIPRASAASSQERSKSSFRAQEELLVETLWVGVQSVLEGVFNDWQVKFPGVYQELLATQRSKSPVAADELHPGTRVSLIQCITNDLRDKCRFAEQQLPRFCVDTLQQRLEEFTEREVDRMVSFARTSSRSSGET